MFNRNNKELTQQFMNWKLIVKVGREGNEYWAHVTYKDEHFVLPWWLDTLYNELAKAVNYNYDTAKVIYEMLEREVNSMLARYQMREAQMNVVQFKFPPAIIPVTTSTSVRAWRIWASDMNFSWATAREYAYNSGPNMCYVTSEEYEKMKEEWTLVAGEIYVVMN